MPVPHLLPRCLACLLAIVVGGFLLSGCSRGPGYPTATITGKVTIAGQPVPKGYITFSPLGQGPVTGAPIADGQYRLENLPAGKHRVTFQAQGAEPMKLYDAAAKIEREVPSDILPDKYRQGVDVDIDRGKATRNFDL